MHVIQTSDLNYTSPAIYHLISWVMIPILTTALPMVQIVYSKYFAYHV